MNLFKIIFSYFLGGKVAGQSTEYVNRVLDKIKAGTSGNAALASSFTDDL